MNTLLVSDSKLNLENSKVDLKIETSKLEIDINGSVCINDLNNNTDLELVIKMHKDSKLLYNRYNEDINNFNLKIILEDDSLVEFNYSLYQNIPSKIKLDSSILGSNNKCSINVCGVTNNNGSINSSATGDIIKNIKNNEFLENIRIMMLNDSENVIIPNLLVSSNEVIVNHNAVISSVPNDYLFYLESKGLNEDNSTKLIVDGFIKNNLKIGEVAL